MLGFLQALDIHVFGKGTQLLIPELGVDPTLIASCIISPLQLIVSREIDYKEPFVTVCGTFHSGTNASIIPESTDFKVDVRSFSKHVQRAAIKTQSCASSRMSARLRPHSTPTYLDFL